MKSLQIAVTVRCPQCRAWNPVLGLYPEQRCHACDGAIPLTWSAWQQVHLGATDSGAEGGDHDKGIFYQSKEAAPACQCGCRLNHVGDSVGATDQPSAVQCGSCGPTINIRNAPSDAKARLESREVVAIIGESQQAPARPHNETVPLKCTDCGAALKADGSSRIVACQYCHASEVLPDAVWLGFSLKPAMHPFYLLFEVDEYHAFEGKPRTASLEAKLEAGTGPKTPSEALGYLVISYQPVETKVRVAHTPSTPDSVLLELARSNYGEMRTAVLERFDRAGGSPELAAAAEVIRAEPARVAKREAERCAAEEARRKNEQEAEARAKEEAARVAAAELERTCVLAEEHARSEREELERRRQADLARESANVRRRLLVGLAVGVVARVAAVAAVGLLLH